MLGSLLGEFCDRDMMEGYVVRSSQLVEIPVITDDGDDIDVQES